ncbi:DUF4129 domain-containing protein [Microbacterium sp. KUDC0406]|uniref:DUF4129 domain-containing protein n=1 Tax=Microbacterium sp. KUDC0406 TaxID=2909588 RepID=UPI001F3AF213|nr:DUF4129 domain-containing protein [Microbacterium sp. KUDC0406]UJP10787.1 DUF4129 domain-containing protein [Microbacterium sp. KUDC0406]
MRRGIRSPEGRTGSSHALLIGIAVGVALILVMLVSALQGLPRFRQVDWGDGEPLPEVSQAPPSGTPTPLPQPERDDLLATIIAVILAVILCLVVLALVVLLLIVIIRRLRELWRGRPLRQRAGADLDEQPAAAAAPVIVDAVVIRRGIAEAIRVIGGSSDPADAIIAAWVGLEQTAADSGVARAASETPREFTLRIIARRAATEQDVVALVDLYEKVRFGGHSADDGDRRTARTLLERLEEEWR